MFPSTISIFSQPSPTDRLNNPSHSALHNTVSSALGQVEAVIGVEGANSVVGTMMYDIHSPDSNGGGHVQTANKGGTGQTTYTKGDLLVASSQSVLTKLGIGTNDTVLIADSATATGVKWGAVPAIVVSSTIAVSSVWTKPAAATATSRVFVELWGGGGSGGHSNAGNEVGGGGGGGYISGWFSASILSSVILNVGRGGNAVFQSNGQDGAISVFDPINSLLTAYAGGGGNAGNGAIQGGGGAGTLQSGRNGATGNDVSGLIGGSRMLSTGMPEVKIAANNTSTFTAYYRTPMGGGGGTCDNNSGAAATTSFVGGWAVYGGAGGAGIGSSVTSGSVKGGLSTFGGNGGDSSILTAGSAMGGFTPGGGGGGAYSGSAGTSSGQGGHGMARITTFL